MGAKNDWVEDSAETDASRDERRRAKVSPVFKQKIMELASDETYEVTTETQLCQLRDELETRERYYLKKIGFYLSEVKIQEAETEKLQTGQLELLFTIKSLKNRITELEAKLLFYRNRLRKLEEG